MPDETMHPLEIVNNRIKAIVERETLDDLFWTSGEIHGVHQSERGHVYFQLSDDNYSIRCILREHQRATIDFTPQSMMEVEVYGTIQIYAERASIEIEVEKIRLVQGQLMSNFASIEAQLREMDKYPNQKKPLPKQIDNIALLTSEQSKAYTDFFNTYVAHKGQARINLIDVRVQGEFAPKQIADAITRVNHDKTNDVIVITRGGGNRRDMTIFDDIIIATAIIDSEIPVITAIGHERDDFWADRVADVKRNTPTDAGSFLANQKSTANSQMLFTIMGISVIVLLIIAIVLMALNS